MEGKGKWVVVSDGSGLIGGYLARARLLTGRVSTGVSTQVRSKSHPEIDDLASTKNAIVECELSPWTRSGAKRAMDVGVVLVFSPILLPALAVVALAVRMTSGAPILFRQERVGRNGLPFVIYKFRTMRPALVHPSSAIAIASTNRITWLGAFLRKTKLDELPQIFNVLTGEMSLVGSRPKVAEQDPEPLPCRPGVTGVATLAFAREDMILRGIASTDLDEYFQKTILSAKRDLDADYLRRATIWSDLWILVNTVLGRWESYGRVTSWLADNESRMEASSHTASLSR